MLCCLLQMLLLSQDYGKHLLGVEDLMQKHSLVESDIAIRADRVKAVNSNAQRFILDTEGESAVFNPTYLVCTGGKTCIHIEMCIYVDKRYSLFSVCVCVCK